MAVAHWTEALTPREADAVRALLAGMRHKEAAHSLGISQHTLSRHLSAIREKSGAGDSRQIVLWAISRGGLGDMLDALARGAAAAATTTPLRLDQWLLTGIRAHADDELWKIRRAIGAELRDRMRARAKGAAAEPRPAMVELDPNAKGHLQWTN